MSESIDVAVLIGSLRAGSFSSRIAAALQERAPPRLRFRTVPIGNLPLYNQDEDGDAAPAAMRRSAPPLRRPKPFFL